MNLKLVTVSLLAIAVASSVALTGCKKKEESAAPEQTTEQTTVVNPPAEQAPAGEQTGAAEQAPAGEQKAEEKAQ